MAKNSIQVSGRRNNFATLLYRVSYLVIAGGGGGGDGGDQGGGSGGGGGAGGYRSNVAGQPSGRGSAAEPGLSVVPGETYQITVGAGAGGNGKGSNSVFGSIVSIGGGAGGYFGGGSGSGVGGSGGGGPGGFGTPGQGFDGQLSGGGGGGGSGSPGSGASGGSGTSSNITGSSVTRAGGGSSGGGVGPGGGGARGAGPNYHSAFGGSGGVVIFTVPINTAVSFSGGVTRTKTTVGSNDVYTVTATSTTSETVTIL